MMRGRVARACAAALLAAGLATSALAATPPGTLDANHACSGADCNVPSAAYPSVNAPVAPGNTDAVTLAQTFTPATSGQLTGVSLDVGVFSGAAVVVPATLTVEVVATDGSGVPQVGTVLASEAVATGTADWPSSPGHGWLDVTFTTPPTVIAGHVYAILLGPSALAAAPWMFWEIDSTSDGGYADYAGGEAYGASLNHATSSWVWNTMYSWLATGGAGTADFAFRTYVQAPAPTPTPTLAPTPASTATPAATPTPFLPTQPPTDALPAGQGGSGAPGALLLALGGLAAAALAARRRVPARRR